MMQQKIDPPNLGFWTLAIKAFQIILASFLKKISWMQVKLENFETRLK